MATLAEVIGFLSRYAPLLDMIFEAEQSGASTEAINLVVKTALTAASDAQFKSELPK